MEVEMPQGSDILRFIAANLAVLASAGCTRFSRTTFRLPSLAHHPTGLHETFHGGIGAERRERRVGLDGTRQVVVVQLVAPVRMVAVLSAETLGQLRGKRHLAAVFADGALQDTHRVILFVSRLVIPTFDRAGGILHIPAGDRMRPDLFGQRLDG